MKKSYEECAAEGMSYAECAEHRGVTKQAVSRYARVHGLKFRREMNEKVDVEDLKRLAAKGLSCTEAAKELGAAVSTVSRANRAMNLGFRDGKKIPFDGHESIAEAARAMGLNYRTVWEYQKAVTKK